MCGRFTQKSERRIIEEEFYIKLFSANPVKSYNIAPGQNAGVIINDGVNRWVQFKWGLVPSWAKDPQMGNKMINARAETVVEKPSFKRAFEHSRCLVPTDGFYEWKKSEKYKVPFFIHLNSQRPFSLAGLWDVWKSEDGERLYTFTIITTEANQFLNSIHRRMPLIVPKAQRDLWLNPRIHMTEELLSLLQPYQDTDILAYEVSRFVNSPENNTQDCIKPVQGNI